MNPNETRSPHPSLVQFKTLVEFMERNPGMAKGFLRTQKARERSRRQWEELAVRLNKITGTIKNSKQWTKYWSDKKSAIKKKVAARSAARRTTGGGVEDEVELSELEERVVALCGGESLSAGDEHLSIQPFPLPNDMENYMQYHLMGSVSQIRLKAGCIPSKFACQPDRRKRTADTIERQYFVKKQRKELIEELQKEIENRTDRESSSESSVLQENVPQHEVSHLSFFPAASTAAPLWTPGSNAMTTQDAPMTANKCIQENDTPSPSHAVQQIQDADTDNIHLPQQQQSQEPPAIVIYGSELIEDSQEHTRNYRLPHPAISRRLLASSSSSTVGTSQSILQNIQLEHTPPPNPHIDHPTLSPPPITLSHTPTPPSRLSSIQVASPVIRRRTPASSSSRHATSIASPSRCPRTNMARASRGAGSVSSSHPSSVAAPPPSQRRTEFSTTTERFLRVEEQQLEIQRLNAQILQSFLERSVERESAMDERSAERDRILAEAVAAVGKGLQALAEAKNRDRQDSAESENEVEVFCPKCRTEVSHTGERIQQDQTKILIAKVYHYFEQEYEELKTIYGDLDLTPLSKFRQRTALATGVSETTILEILKEEEERNADKREEPPEKRHGARKRSMQTESSRDEDCPDDNTDADEESNTLDEAQTVVVKVETEYYNDEPEIYVPAPVKEELSDIELNKEQPQTDPIALDVTPDRNPRTDVLDNTNETLALTEPAATKRKGRKIPRSDVTSTSTNQTLALTEPAATKRKGRTIPRSDVTSKRQHTQGECSTAAASSSVRLTEELDEDSLLGDTEMKTEEIGIHEERPS